MVLAATPVSYTPAGGFQTSEACADGTCCGESDSICGLNGQNYENKYWTQSGPCPKAADIEAET